MTGALSIPTARRLGILIGLVDRNARVRWMSDVNDDILTGTLRYFCVGQGGFPGPNDDVRDANVRITTTSGFEVFVPVTRALYLLEIGGFAED